MIDEIKKFPIFSIKIHKSIKYVGKYQLNRYVKKINNNIILVFSGQVISSMMKSLTSINSKDFQLESFLLGKAVEFLHCNIKIYKRISSIEIYYSVLSLLNGHGF